MSMPSVAAIVESVTKLSSIVTPNEGRLFLNRLFRLVYIWRLWKAVGYVGVGYRCGSSSTEPRSSGSGGPTAISFRYEMKRNRHRQQHRAQRHRGKSNRIATHCVCVFSKVICNCNSRTSAVHWCCSFHSIHSFHAAVRSFHGMMDGWIDLI